jgi:hypothetical protein
VNREKQNDESDVHLPQPQNKSGYLLHIFFVLYRLILSRFWAFCNKQGEFKVQCSKHDTYLKQKPQNKSAAAKKST